MIAPRPFAKEDGHDESSLYGQLAQQPYPYLVRCAESLAERLSSELGRTVAATDVLIDAPPPHREVEFAVSIIDAGL